MNLRMEDVLTVAHLSAHNVKIARKGFAGVCTDSRKVRRGELFVALRGDNFDGNAFVGEAFINGAAAAVVDSPVGRRGAGPNPVVVVKDAAKALMSIAGVYRSKFAIPVLAVAGSNGKTTTKEMIASVLGKKYRVLSTEGNLNNHIGVPMTLFGLRPGHGAAVVEMGTNHFGEVRYLADTARPTHGVITNIGREHLQFFKNLSGVANAEGELFEYLAASGGTAFVNADDDRVARLAGKNATTVPYGFGARACTVRGKGLETDRSGHPRFTVHRRRGKPFGVKLAVPGRHAASNALAAAAIGIAFGVPAVGIRSALAEFRPVGKRMETVKAGGVTILNDTYNANPESVISALETLGLFAGRGRRIVVLADMLELGKNARREHKLAGAAIRAQGFTEILAYGPLAAYYLKPGGHGKHYADKRRLAEDLCSMTRPGDVVLVKGSRGMKMEEVVASLVEYLGRAA
ncbi:MAG TPA: UDP-N-acetylmuramoyl-tripeptide--D-alanyl-D-alanine ligase [Bacteroidota bacterium]|nr:UDP-N-acetylmuramoyl-tripeptide--D-alanyl-D-alanine ligase [Bacteroidota bacterium]